MSSPDNGYTSVNNAILVSGSYRLCHILLYGHTIPF